MTEAVGSNSTSTLKIQPVYLVDSIYDLEQALHIYKTMLEKLIDTPLIREIADLRQRIANQPGMHENGLSKTPLADQAAADYADLLKYRGGYQMPVAPASGEKARLDIKSLRNEFIVRKLQHGFTVRQIAQALNMHPSFIRKIEKKLQQETVKKA